MKIILKKIKVKSLTKNYTDHTVGGVTGYNGKLNVRPAYQREFVYKDTQRNKVIDSIVKGLPLNVMYWMDNGDDTFELMDGQQRTISICRYVAGDFSIKHRFFHNLDSKEQKQILDYDLMIYYCSGTDAERLDWFETINIAGEKLTLQEIRNAIYTGPWLSDAKLKFSKPNCAAYVKAKDFMRGSPIRQDYLETVLKWINDGDIEDYMAKHQKDSDASELLTYFIKVIDWFEDLFPKYYKEMKGLPIGDYHTLFQHDDFNTRDMDAEAKVLIADDEVTKKKGIFLYLLSGDEKHLSIRSFTITEKRNAFEDQKGVCNECTKIFKIEDMEADHVIAWSKGGKTNKDNCQVLCKKCNRKKGSDD